MTVEEIFASISAHMVEGMMVHSQLVEYYEFLNLPGYAECHKYHYFDESWNYQDLMMFYIEHYNKLLPSGPVNDPEIIPIAWYKYDRFDVDAATRKSSVKSGLEKWVAWEKKTKEMLEKAYKNLLEIGEVAAVNKICELVECVTKELKDAETYHLNKKAIDYDIGAIMSEQKTKKSEYESKCRSIFLHN